MNAIAGGRRRRKGTNSTRWGPEGESGSCNRREPHSSVEILILQDAEQRSGLFERRQAAGVGRTREQVASQVSRLVSASASRRREAGARNRDQPAIWKIGINSSRMVHLIITPRSRV